MTSSLARQDRVFAEHGRINPAVAVLRAWKADAVVDAKFEFDELTVTIAPDDIRGACRAVLAAGYNFLEDVTCVDWYPVRASFSRDVPHPVAWLEAAGAAAGGG